MIYYVCLHYTLNASTYWHSPDSATDSFIWSVIEVGISITAASVVTMRPLLRAMRIEGFGSTRDTAYPSRTTENIGPYSNELSDLPTSNITKDISMEYTISPIDRLSETGSEEDILYARNATTSRAWSANAKEETWCLGPCNLCVFQLY